LLVVVPHAVVIRVVIMQIVVQQAVVLLVVILHTVVDQVVVMQIVVRQAVVQQVNQGNQSAVSMQGSLSLAPPTFCPPSHKRRILAELSGSRLG
jgi:hypothetical protein